MDRQWPSPLLRTATALLEEVANTHHRSGLIHARQWRRSGWHHAAVDRERRIALVEYAPRGDVHRGALGQEVHRARCNDGTSGTTAHGYMAELGVERNIRTGQ